MSLNKGEGEFPQVAQVGAVSRLGDSDKPKLYQPPVFLPTAPAHPGSNTEPLKTAEPFEATIAWCRYLRKCAALDKASKATVKAVVPGWASKRRG